MTFAVVLVGLWVGGAVICGYVAHQRNRSGPGWGLLALMFSPFLIVLVLLAIPVGTSTNAAPEADPTGVRLDGLAATKALPIVFVVVIVLGVVLLLLFGD